MSPSIWALVTSASARTAVPSSARVPTAGRVTIFTLASVSPASASAKPKSSASKAYAVPATAVTVLSAPVGAVLVPASSASVLNAVADWAHWLFPIALLEWTRTSYAVSACRFVMTVRVTGVSPAYQFVQSVVPSTR